MFNFENFYSSLSNNWNLSGIKYISFLSSMGQLFLSGSTPSPWKFFSTYLNSWESSQEWLISLIAASDEREQFNQYIELFKMLRDNNQFNENNVNLLVSSRKRQEYIDAIKELKENDISTNENLATIFLQTNPIQMAQAFIQLAQNGLLTTENRALLLQKRQLISELPHLENNVIFDPEYFQMMIRHANPCEFAYLLTNLYKAHLLVPENVLRITGHHYAHELSIIFHTLQNAHLLDQRYFDFLINIRSIKPLEKGIVFLNNLGILNQDTFSAVVSASDPGAQAQLICDLHHAGYLNSENLQLIAESGNASLLNQAFEKRTKLGVKLSQNAFTHLIRHQAPVEYVEALYFIYGNPPSKPKLDIPRHLNETERFKSEQHFKKLFDLLEMVSDKPKSYLNNSMVLEAIAHHQRPYDLVKGFSELYEANVFNVENQQLLINHRNPLGKARELLNIKQEKEPNPSFLFSYHENLKRTIERSKGENSIQRPKL